MVKSTCMSFVKYIIFFVNILFVIFSLILIMIGIFLETVGVTIFADTQYLSMPVIIILTGVIIFIVAFFGCCGAINEKTWKLLVYGVVMLVICALQIGCIVFAYMYRQDTEAFVKSSMKKSLSQQKKDHVKVWDKMQEGWQCCGVDGASDYTADGLSVPASCCPAGTSECSESNAYGHGCYQDIVKFIDDNVNVVGGVGGIAAMAEICVAVIAFCLASTIRSEGKQESASRQHPHGQEHHQQRRHPQAYQPRRYQYGRGRAG